MIVAVYGIPGLSFAELTYLLTDLGIGFMAAANGKPSKVGSPTRDHVVPIVFGSAKVFVENHKKVKFRAVALVCDTYTRLKKELDWPLVGVRELPKDQHEYMQFDRQELGALLQEADKFTEATSVNLNVKVYDPTTDLISTFGDSALSQAQTLMYKVKNQDMRSRTFACVKAWFTGQIKSADALYTKLKSIHDNEKYIDSLLGVLTSKDGNVLRKVVIQGKNDPDKIDALARKVNITPFDIRYLLSTGKKK